MSFYGMLEAFEANCFIFPVKTAFPILEAKLDTPLGLKWMEKFLDVTELGVTCKLANNAVLRDNPSEKFHRWNRIV